MAESLTPGQWRRTRSTIAHARRRDPNADTTELFRQMRAEKLADHIREVIASPPPLNEAQRSLVAAVLLHPSLAR
jgi:hypothetical protein